MKAEHLTTGVNLYTAWQNICKLEIALHCGADRLIRDIFVPTQASGIIDLQELVAAGLDRYALSNGIRDLILDMLDRNATLLLDKMKQMDIDTDALATQRENAIRDLKKD